MPALPKDPDELRDRRPSRRAPSTTLPASGFDGPIPDPPADLAPELVGEYVALWRSPAAAAWLAEEAELVVELVELRALCSATRRRGAYPPGTAMARCGAIEDRLALSPRARATLRYRVVDDPPPEPTSRHDGQGPGTLPADVVEKLREMGHL
jgi:hypothetical protein